MTTTNKLSPAAIDALKTLARSGMAFDFHNLLVKVEYTIYGARTEITDIPIRQRGVSYRVALPPPGDNRLVTFADRLKERRNQYGLSQREISAVIGIDQSQYSRYEKGTVPTQEVLKKISDLLECSIDFLLGATDDPGVIREFENLPEDEKNLVLIYRAYKRGLKIPRAGIKMLRDLDLFDDNTGLLIEGPKQATPPGQEEAPDRKVI